MRLMSPHPVYQIDFSNYCLPKENILSIEAAKLLTLRAAWTRDKKTAKLFAAEAVQRVIDEAVQIHGGHGLIRGTRVEYLYRTIRALRIYEGTSEIQRLTITRAARRRGDR